MFIIKYKYLPQILIILKIETGIIFWIVDNKKITISEVFFTIDKNHLWKGAIPNFKLSAKKTKSSIFLTLLIILNNEKIINVMEARLCTKKYLIILSKQKSSISDMIGKNLNMLISKASHIVNLDLLPSVMSKLKISNILNITKGLKINILT